MPDDLRTRIAAIVSAHTPGHLPDEGIDCNCGEGFRPESRGWVERAVEVERLWSQHVADALIRELNLEPQDHYDPDCPYYRYVTDWINPLTGNKVDLP